MKALKKNIKTFLKDQLRTNEAWAKRALLRIYEYQTDYERQAQETTDRNFVGFNGADADILSSFANQLATRGFLSKNQMVVLYHKMPKYWNQIWNLSDQKAIINMVEGL